MAKCSDGNLSSDIFCYFAVCMRKKVECDAESDELRTIYCVSANVWSAYMDAQTVGVLCIA